MILRKLSVHFEYCYKLFFFSFPKEDRGGNSLCSIKAKIERCGVSEGEATIGIIDVGRTKTQISEENVNGATLKPGDFAEIPMDEVDLPFPRGKVSCGLCKVFLVSVDTDELSGRSDVRKEGTGVTTESYGYIEDGFSFRRSEDPEDLFLKDRDMVDGVIWLYILILFRF